jgi:hypothetical protein
MKDVVQIAVGLMALIGILYGVLKVESSIYKSIDDLGKAVHSRINAIERDLALHIALCAERKDQVDYLIHANDEKIEHKANRFFEEIKEIKLELKHKQKPDEV